MKLLFVVNPISGNVNKEPFLKEAKTLCNKYRIDFEVFKTTGKNDELSLRKILEQFSPDKVLSVGGDGTTLFTSLTLLGTEYPMGIIPLGSANGMATELFVNPDPIEALKDVIMSDIVAGLDLLKINETYYTMHIGDIGVNAHIVEAYEKDPKRGMASYAKYFIDQLTKLKPFHATIRANGKTYREKLLMLAICNARKYGTGVPLNVVGSPMDGLFEIVLVKRISASSLIKAGLAKFDENFLDHQASKVIAAEYAEVELEKPHLLQLDGEVIGKFKELKLEILKGAVQFITHAENKYLEKYL